MNRQFLEQQRKLKEEEERVNDLIKKWDFYNSDKSKKFFNFPTMQELKKYEDNFKAYGYEEHGDKLEHDLNYIDFIIEKTEKYDFFIPCRLNNHEFYPLFSDFCQHRINCIAFSAPCTSCNKYMRSNRVLC